MATCFCLVPKEEKVEIYLHKVGFSVSAFIFYITGVNVKNETFSQHLKNQTFLCTKSTNSIIWLKYIFFSLGQWSRIAAVIRPQTVGTSYLFTDYWDNKISEMCSYQIPAADESIVHNCQNRTVHVYCAQYFISRYCWIFHINFQNLPRTIFLYFIINFYQ
jgi:hypothetical protein